jgi:hypothetical protein
LNTANLTNNISRIEILCSLFGERFRLWIDPGSPNTLVSTKFITIFGLAPAGTRKYSGKVAGEIFRNKSTVVIPQIVLPECMPMRNIRALAALESNEWDRVIVLGLNVLNHMTYKISRENGTFEWLESLTSSVVGSDRDRFNHVIWNGKYLLVDEDNSSQ